MPSGLRGSYKLHSGDLSHRLWSTKSNPVCSTDGVTSTNRCYLECVYSKTFAYAGPCVGNCEQSTANDPVCGMDGITYRNRDLAICEGIVIRHVGACEFDCKNALCSTNYESACASNGLT